MTSEHHAPSNESGTNETALQGALGWRRFGARSFDYIIFFTLLEYLRAPSGMAWYLVYWASWIPIEAMLLSAFGMTAGKYMFDLEVRYGDEKRINALTALKRSFEVWVFGVGCGLPVISLVAMALAFARLKDKGKSLWDQRAGTNVYIRQLELLRPLLAIGIAILIQLPLIAY